jgi:hypothetical protein
MNKYLKIGFLLIGVIVVSVVIVGCAEKGGVDQVIGSHTYGFWSGLLHGFIAPFDFIGMLFSDHIVMYAPNNNGAWYAFGFLIGSGGWGFLSNKGARYRRRPKQDYGSAEVL